MINFLRISKSSKIEFGDYLHSNGKIDSTPSNDVIGICVIPSNFLPDGLARFMSIQKSRGIWNRDIDVNYKRKLPNKYKYLEGLDREFLSGPSLISPYLSDGSLNPDFLKDLSQGNAFQDYKGYENTEKYRKKYGELEDLRNVFNSCFRISPSYRKSEWYLPSIGELVLLYEKRTMIDEKISLALNAGSEGVILSPSTYWSSSGYDSEFAWLIDMTVGFVGYIPRDYSSCVRAFLTL